jgi:hypothetical protein
MNNLTSYNPAYPAYFLNVKDVGLQPYSNKNNGKHEQLFKRIVLPFIEDIAKTSIKTIKEQKISKSNNKSSFILDVTECLNKNINKINQLLPVIKETEEVKQVMEQYVLQKSHSFEFKYKMTETEVEEWVECISSDFKAFAKKSSELEF